MLKNYTTKIPANKSIQEIQETLQRYGAICVLMEYEEGTKRIEQLSFKLEFNKKILAIRLPLKWREVKEVLILQGIKRAKNDDDYVYRVAWRILKYWIDSQMTIVELNMVKIEQIFLPYIINKNGCTVGENFINKNLLLITR